MLCIHTPSSLVNRHDSDRLLDDLLDPSVSDEGTLGCASTELIVDIPMAHLSPHSLLGPHSIESAECAVKTVSLLLSLLLSSLSV